MSKRIIAYMAIIAAIGILFAGSVIVSRNMSSPAPTSFASRPISVRTTVFPYAEVARAVIGSDVVSPNAETADIRAITPVGVEPHDFEPTPGDIAELIDADIVIYNGAGLDSWVEEAVRERQTATSKITINVSDIAPTKIANDPHFWLSIDNLSALASTLAPTAITTKQFIDQLAALDAAYRTTLEHCRRTDAIVGHRAFDYIAQRYHTNFISIRDINPEQEPSPQRIATIIDTMRQKNIRYILTEPLTPVKEIDTIRAALDAMQATQIMQATLDPMEAIANPERTLFDIWNQNLIALTAALDCAPQK